MLEQKIPEIGWWYAECCRQDLYQIETEEDLRDVLKAIKDHNADGFTLQVWPTKEEALKVLDNCGDSFK